MSDLQFVLAGYLVVVGGVAAYAVMLRRRLAAARIRRAAMRAFSESTSDDAAPVHDASPK